MFNQSSNMLFNNILFNDSTISAMHESMVRLYKAAFDSKKVKGQSAVAHAMGESPQTVKNWEQRGISKRGAIRAEELFGCTASALLSSVVSYPRAATPKILSVSEETRTYGWPFESVTPQMYDKLSEAQRKHIEQTIHLLAAGDDSSNQEPPANYGRRR